MEAGTKAVLEWLDGGGQDGGQPRREMILIFQVVVDHILQLVITIINFIIIILTTVFVYRGLLLPPP